MPTSTEWQAAVDYAIANKGIQYKPFDKLSLLQKVVEYFDNNTISYSTFNYTDVENYIPVLLEESRRKLRKKISKANINGDTWCFVGDSITEGTDYDEYIMSKYPNITHIDEGIGGNTTLDIIDRIDSIKAHNADMYVICVGINDARYNDSRGATNSTDYWANMRQIIDDLLTVGEVIVISIWPNYPPDQFDALGYESTRDRIINWNSGLKTICENEQEQRGILPYIDANTILRANINSQADYDTYVPDGVHPNEQGLIRYARAVMYGFF